MSGSWRKRARAYVWYTQVVSPCAYLSSMPSICGHYKHPFTTCLNVSVCGHVLVYYPLQCYLPAAYEASHLLPILDQSSPPPSNPPWAAPRLGIPVPLGIQGLVKPN